MNSKSTVLTLALMTVSLGACQLEYEHVPEPLETPPVEDEEPAPENDDVPEPVAQAGPDRIVRPLETVTLDAKDSYDPDGRQIEAYEWVLQSKPSGSTTTLSEKDEVAPTFWVDVAGDYVFTLSVRNDLGMWDSTPDEIVVTAEPLEGFYVELTWDTTPTDLDLHLINGSAPLFDSVGDCNYCNMTPEWGTSSYADNPSLDWDVVDGYGPETASIEAPAAGTYVVKAHYYGENGSPSCWDDCPETRATLKVYIDGVEQASITGTLKDQGDVWTAAEISWPSGDITTIDTMGWTSETFCSWW